MWGRACAFVHLNSTKYYCYDNKIFCIVRAFLDKNTYKKHLSTAISPVAFSGANLFGPLFGVLLIVTLLPVDVITYKTRTSPAPACCVARPEPRPWCHLTDSEQFARNAENDAPLRPCATTLIEFSHLRWRQLSTTGRSRIIVP